MRKHWLKSMTAWLLAALIAVSPALAEDAQAAEIVAECAEAFVAEADAFELGGEDDLIAAEEDELVLPPEATEAPQEVVEAPAVTETLVPTEELQVTVTPVPTETPAASETPALTEAPAVTETPEPTEETAASETPALTEGPAATVTPEATEEPIETPVVTEEPIATETREPTEQPTVTETPVPTEAPAATPSPEAELPEAPEATPQPEVEASAQPELLAEAQPTLQLNVEKLTMGKGEKRTLVLTLDGGAPTDVTWKSSKPKVVAVSAAGKLTAKKKGSATITATTPDGLTASCAVKVVSAPSKVTLTKKATLGVGEVCQLTAKLPKGTGSKLSWSSSAPGVATVDAEGRVTAVAAGTAKITVKTFNKKKAVCKVTVKAAPTGVSIGNAARTLGVGMKADMLPAVSDGAGSVALSSDNPAVLSVSGGTVTAVGVGAATLTATAYNGVSASVDMTVVPAPTAISLATPVTLGVGEKLRLSPQIDDGAMASYTFKTSSKKVATVSAKGTVKGKKKGTATITVTTHNGLKAKVKVKVVKAPSKVTLSPKTVTLGRGGSAQLTAKLPKGTSSTITYTSSDTGVVTVDEAGRLYGVGPGTATVTAVTFNKKKATCKVTVTEDAQAPAQPGNLTLSALGNEGFTVSWSKSDLATGYRVYLGVDSAEPERYGDYGADVTSAALRGLTPGVTYRIYVTAYNTSGESALNADACVTGSVSGETTGDAVSLSEGMVMLKVGGSFTLSATVSPSGDADGVTWETTTPAIAKISASGGSCTVTGVAAGTATVSAELPNGASASATVMVVNTGDLSSENFSAVQKALLKHEDLVDGTAGGDVIWDMVAQSLLNSNYTQAHVTTMIAKLKGADALYRNLYLYSFGAYTSTAEATRDKKGNVVSVSNYDPEDNTLYLVPNSLSDDSYAYVAFHEIGHAVDYNADGNQALNSLNSEAAAALTADVRALLTDRVSAAAAKAEVSKAAISGQRIVDALLNYRELLHHDEVMATLTADEQKVYAQLSADMASEMNATLPVNNGCMVWDAIEGATNFAVSGNFGHAYLLQMPAYKEAATYYFYDRKGNPMITSEPWAEFFSSNIMQDAATLSVNLSYLPQTCKYFAETFAPKVLEYFKNLVRSK